MITWATRAGMVALVAVVFLGVACGSDTPTGGPDGQLDCQVGSGAGRVTAGTAWEQELSFGEGHEGSRTPFDAMVKWSDGLALTDYGIHVVNSRTGTVVIEGEEVAVMTVGELPTETFEVVSAQGCPGIEPAQLN